MKLTKVRLLYNRLKRQVFSRVYLTRIIIITFLLGLSLLIGPFLFRFGQGLLSFTTGQLPQSSGRINFLLLGVGGSNHDGPDLTDSLTFISVNINSGTATLLSIPRDLWVPSLKAKINSAYHYGEAKQPGGGGLTLVKSSVSEVLGQPVNFAIVIDFSTFAQAIDLLGGVDVHIDNSFTDSHYPISGRENTDCPGDPLFTCRYETIAFSAGNRHLDGAAALKFVRSRYALGDEGTDFARSRRQAKVLTALKSKLTSWAILTHPHLYLDLYRLLSKNIISDLHSNQYYALARLGLTISRHPLKTFALSEPDQLYNPPLSDDYDNQWILLPKDNHPQIIFDYVSSLLN